VVAEGKAMKSLMILSFPRSMSSLVADVCANSLEHQLKRPEWKSCEILHAGNPLITKQTTNHSVYTSKWSDYRKALKAHAEDYVIKDVNQPWICADYIAKNPDDYNVLFIRRPLNEVVYSIFKAGWFWPIHSLYKVDSSTKKLKVKLTELRETSGIGRTFEPTAFHFSHALPALIDACVHIDKQCYSGLNQKISYHNMINDHNRIFTRLEAFGYSPKHYNYMNDAFKTDRARVFRYRKDPVWHIVRGAVEDRCQ
jgi:hypothetical protein